MEITNLSWNENLSKRFNNPLLPRSIRGLIVGKSGCGKTTLLLNLLLKPGWLDYDTLFVFGKSLFQPEYKILRTAFAEGLPKEYILRLFNMRNEIQNSQIPPTLLIKEWVSSLNKESDIKSYFFESATDVPDPRELNSEDKNLMIFDDLLLEKQNKTESYYVRGRHSNVDCFYLAQNYFKLPRQTIRENSNLICLFRQDLKSLNHIYADHVGDDMTKEELVSSHFANFGLKSKKILENLGWQIETRSIGVIKPLAILSFNFLAQHRPTIPFFSLSIYPNNATINVILYCFKSFEDFFHYLFILLNQSLIN